MNFANLRLISRVQWAMTHIPRSLFDPVKGKIVASDKITILCGPR